jgi:hypothetical protein
MFTISREKKNVLATKSILSCALHTFAKMENIQHVISIKMVQMTIKTINKHFMSPLNLNTEGRRKIVMTLKACNDLSLQRQLREEEALMINAKRAP